MTTASPTAIPTTLAARRQRTLHVYAVLGHRAHEVSAELRRLADLVDDGSLDAQDLTPAVTPGEGLLHAEFSPSTAIGARDADYSTAGHWFLAERDVEA